MATLHIHPRVIAGPASVRYEFDLVSSSCSPPRALFYEVARDDAPAFPSVFDGVLCAVVLHAMAERLDIHLHAPATGAMLRNLSEFQLAWTRWRPTVYTPIEIRVDAAVEARVGPCRALSAFSGGVDSTFTLLRNDPGSATPRYAVGTAMLVQGFDIALANDDALADLVARTAPVRARTGVGLRIVRTNSKELRLQSWADSCGAQLAACLHLFSAEFSHALIASSDSYDELWLPWGTNPVTDHLLSGGHLTIVHDGAAFSRTDKVVALSQEPAALRSLKVCWEGREQGRNCGVCEKCVRTQINLLAAGVADAPCFDQRLDPRAIRTLPIESDLVLAELKSIVEYGERHALDEPWFRALRRRVSQGRGPGRRRSTFRGRIRRSLARVRLLDAARRVRSRLALLATG